MGGVGGIALIGGIFAFWLMRSRKNNKDEDTTRMSVAYYPPSSPGQQYGSTPDPSKSPASGYGNGWPQPQTPYVSQPAVAQPGGFRPYVSLFSCTVSRSS